jgi:hypothetical protein
MRSVIASTLALNTMNLLRDLYDPKVFSRPRSSGTLKRDLYGFFVSGLSVIEGFCYALYAIAAMLRSDRFPITTDENKKNVHPKLEF